MGGGLWGCVVGTLCGWGGLGLKGGRGDGKLLGQVGGGWRVEEVVRGWTRVEEVGGGWRRLEGGGGCRRL